jgi:hypothetical protein
MKERYKVARDLWKDALIMLDDCVSYQRYKDDCIRYNNMKIHSYRLQQSFRFLKD